MGKLSLIQRFSIIAFLVTGAGVFAFGNLLNNILEENMINSGISDTVDLVHRNVVKHFEVDELLVPKTGRDYDKFSHEMEHLSLSQNTTKIKIWNRDMAIVWSYNKERVGKKFPEHELLKKAFAGKHVAVRSSVENLKVKYSYGEERSNNMEIYVPIVFNPQEEIKVVVEVYENLDLMFKEINKNKLTVWMWTCIGSLATYVIFFGIVWTGSRRIDTQNKKISAMYHTLKRKNEELVHAYDSTIEGWSKAMDLRDKETEGHSHRVTEMTLRIAEKMDIKDDALVHVRRGALLHDMGKMGIPDSILLKPGPLTDEEWVIMKRHPEYAYEMLYLIDHLRSSIDIPYYHHEKWDGTGYPKGLAGDDIPVVARIFAVVDVWDALRSDRPYRLAWSEEKTREHILSLSGTHFDPAVCKVFFEMIDEMEGLTVSETPTQEQLNTDTVFSDI